MVDDNNGKRELGEIQATLRHIQGDIGEIKDDVKDLRGQVSVHCNETIGLSERVAVNFREIDTLRKHSQNWDIANSFGVGIGTIIASVVAWMKS